MQTSAPTKINKKLTCPKVGYESRETSLLEYCDPIPHQKANDNSTILSPSYIANEYQSPVDRSLRANTSQTNHSCLK